MNKFKLALLSGASALGTLFLGLTAHAQSIPTVGTSDISSVGGAILSPLIVGGEWLMTQFGPPLLMFGFVVLIYWTIRSYVRHRKVKV